MEIIKILGVGLISVIIAVVIRQYRPEFGIYISLIAGIIIITMIINKIDGIINILKDLVNKTSLNREFLSILLKVTGIAILTEYIVSICKDVGESSIANKVELGGKVLIMSLSIPIMGSLLETVLKVLPS